LVLGTSYVKLKETFKKSKPSKEIDFFKTKIRAFSSGYDYFIMEPSL
jgi:hypothetical protein